MLQLVLAATLPLLAVILHGWAVAITQPLLPNIAWPAPQGQWLASALGGPLPYRGPDPAALYTRLVQEKGLNGIHLDTLAQHLAGSMAELEIAAVSGAATVVLAAVVTGPVARMLLSHLSRPASCLASCIPRLYLAASAI